MKHFILYILLNIVLLASDINPQKVKILEVILNEISIDSSKIIWSDNNTLLNDIKANNILHTVADCKSANIIILEKNILPIECKNKYIFVLDYKLLSEIDTSFGALFWKKGRPNIIILEPRIDKQSIKIKDKLKPYLEERIW